MEFFSLGDSLFLCSPVLEPDLDLSVSQLKILGKLRPLGDGEVTLGFVFPLQLLQLVGGEGRPRLPVRLVFPQDGAGQDWRLLVVVEAPQQHQLGGAGGVQRHQGRGRGEEGRRGHAVGPEGVRGTGGGP